ncbi:MAG: hypothetical protein OEM93_12810 [Rhodospirillales bacterium]|nr:hypothetical protein [Rhodospirillales bacterium]
MPIVDFSAGLKAGANVTAGPELDLATKIVFPHLERLALDCSNCGGRAFAVAVSPLRGEVKTAATIQAIACVRCGGTINVLDGIVHGRESTPLIKPAPGGAAGS